MEGKIFISALRPLMWAVCGVALGGYAQAQSNTPSPVAPDNVTEFNTDVMDTGHIPRVLSLYSAIFDDFFAPNAQSGSAGQTRHWCRKPGRRGFTPGDKGAVSRHSLPASVVPGRRHRIQNLLHSGWFASVFTAAVLPHATADQSMVAVALSITPW